MEWATFGFWLLKLWYVLESDLLIYLKWKVFDQCILLVLTCRTETITLIKKSTKKLLVAQKRIGRSILKKPNNSKRCRVLNDETQIAISLSYLPESLIKAETEGDYMDRRYKMNSQQLATFSPKQK